MKQRVKAPPADWFRSNVQVFTFAALVASVTDSA